MREEDRTRTVTPGQWDDSLTSMTPEHWESLAIDLTRQARALIGMGYDHAMEAEDLAQEVLIALWQRQDVQIRDVHAYAMAILRRRYIDHLRKHQSKEVVSLDRNSWDDEDAQSNLRESLVGSSDLEGEVESREQWMEYCQMLPSQERTLLILRQMGFSYEEVASVTGLQVASVYTMLSRARQRMRSTIGLEKPEKKPSLVESERVKPRKTQSLVVELYEQEHLTVPQIAERLQCSEVTVRSHLSRGRKETGAASPPLGRPRRTEVDEESEHISPAVQQVLQLYYGKKLDVSAIALSMGKTEQEVRALLKQARTELRRIKTNAPPPGRRGCPRKELEPLQQKYLTSLATLKELHLPGHYEKVLELFYLKQMSVENVAKEQGLKAEKVKACLTRARNFLLNRAREEEQRNVPLLA